MVMKPFVSCFVASKEAADGTAEGGPGVVQVDHRDLVQPRRSKAK